MRAPSARRVLLESSRLAALATTWFSRRAFERSLRAPAAAQNDVLARAVRSLSATNYGAHHGLLSSDGYPEFSTKLPIVTYDDLKPWLVEQMSDENRALVPGPVRFYERTSGSSGGVKDIPYGDDLWAVFQHAFTVWLGDLLLHGPRLSTGRSWISVSPWTSSGSVTDRGVRVGLDDDGEYVRGWLGALLRLFWTVPSSVRAVSDPDDYKRVVAAHLLADEDLEIVSIWNPTLFLLLLDTMASRTAELLADVSRGETRAGVLRFPLRRAGPERLSVLRAALAARDWPSVWPRLKLLSCWDMGEAARPAATLSNIFPGAFLQGKGHLATESAVTIPWTRANACVPLVDSVFFEFEGADGVVRRLHELEDGAEYALIVTPEGGFARYRLGDRVRVTGRFLGTPTLAFAGRCDDVSDLVGEKLDASFVSAALDELCAASAFRALVPVHEGDRPGRYALVLDHGACSAQELDDALRRSPLYAHARALGQLAAPTVSVRLDAAERFGRFYAERGARWGGVKSASLVKDAEQGRALARSLDL
jgi:hypothetical protein